MRVGGPNSGHCVVDGEGRKWPLQQVPVSAVVDKGTDLVIAAGSEIDLSLLSGEVEALDAAGYDVSSRLWIDKEATVLEKAHGEEETAAISTGTTGKGVGFARAARCRREATLYRGETNTQELLREGLERGERVLIEGTQGYVLGTHAGHYPYCTSGDCRAIDMVAATGLGMQECDVWVCLRTYPIRIAGNSGELPNETTWQEIGQEAEYTTVTKKVRRVGAWNNEWAKASVDANSGGGKRAKVALTFADYWWPELEGTRGEMEVGDLPGAVERKVRQIELAINTKIGMLGTGPATQIWLVD